MPGGGRPGIAYLPHIIGLRRINAHPCLPPPACPPPVGRRAEQGQAGANRQQTQRGGFGYVVEVIDVSRGDPLLAPEAKVACALGRNGAGVRDRDGDLIGGADLGVGDLDLEPARGRDAFGQLIAIGVAGRRGPRHERAQIGWGSPELGEPPSRLLDAYNYFATQAYFLRRRRTSISTPPTLSTASDAGSGTYTRLSTSPISSPLTPQFWVNIPKAPAPWVAPLPLST